LLYDGVVINVLEYLMCIDTRLLWNYQNLYWNLTDEPSIQITGSYGK